jgi:uncharacterized protein YcfJ
LTEYEPVVDTYNVDMAAFESDLFECRNIGLRVQAEYERKNKKEREEATLAGLVIGALAGAVIGSVSGEAGDGAVVGGTVGLLEGASAETTYDPVKGPRRIIDHCMKKRGYDVLSDLGVGG